MINQSAGALFQQLHGFPGTLGGLGFVFIAVAYRGSGNDGHCCEQKYWNVAPGCLWIQWRLLCALTHTHAHTLPTPPPAVVEGAPLLVAFGTGQQENPLVGLFKSSSPKTKTERTIQQALWKSHLLSHHVFFVFVKCTPSPDPRMIFFFSF